MKKVLMVMAHPDDEIIFGWPILQNEILEKKIQICSSDFFNPQRQWCKHRKEALFAIAKTVGAEVKCLDYPSEFYRAPTRPQGQQIESDGQIAGPYRNLCQHIVNTFLEMEQDCDAVFTHNPYGEYGHIDHTLVFDLVMKNTTKDVVITDIVQPSNWAVKPSLTNLMQRTYYSECIETNCKSDQTFLDSCKKEYEKKNAEQHIHRKNHCF